MSDRFPLRPDADWYDALVARYGAAVPAPEHMQFRRGLQAIVGDLFEKLQGLGLIDKVDICSIVTRNAAFHVIDARYADSLSEVELAALDFALEDARGDLCESCEHCGRPGDVIAKRGMEALLDDPDAALGDRFLCTECYTEWRHRDV
jgi:hypothetical protein